MDACGDDRGEKDNGQKASGQHRRGAQSVALESCEKGDIAACGRNRLVNWGAAELGSQYPLAKKRDSGIGEQSEDTPARRHVVKDREHFPLVAMPERRGVQANEQRITQRVTSPEHFTAALAETPGCAA